MMTVILLVVQAAWRWRKIPVPAGCQRRKRDPINMAFAIYRRMRIDVSDITCLLFNAGGRLDWHSLMKGHSESGWFWKLLISFLEYVHV
jgi:hypothetical protein